MVGHQEEEVVESKMNMSQTIKGKRTKRQREPSPLALTKVSSSSSITEGYGNRRYIDISGGLDRSSTSPPTSIDSTEEEEDMAYCLMLLAQGQNQLQIKPSKPAEILDVYRCKTCNRCFPTFQALGGHRASHKKLKDQKAALGKLEAQETRDQLHNTTLSLQIVANRGSCNIIKSNKVHECSVCGAEFSSGQALGGHMRRHRTLATSMVGTVSTSSTHPEIEKTRNVLSLDLNLPAPEESFRESKFLLGQPLAFSTSPLVDCHY